MNPFNRIKLIGVSFSATGVESASALIMRIVEACFEPDVLPSTTSRTDEQTLGDLIVTKH